MDNVPNKTFAIKRPRDFLDKLEWDLAQLRNISPHDQPAFFYQAINCAITAWQMADWVFDHLTVTQRQNYVAPGKGIQAFRHYLQDKFLPLAICREIADASKHGRLDKNPNLEIGTESMETRLEGTGENITYWFVGRNREIHEIRRVIDDTVAIWHALLDANGLLIRSSSMGE